MAHHDRSFETTLHDVVYSIDVGTGLKIIRVALFVLFILLISMIYVATQFRGLNNAEAMDYAQLGRNFSLNGGMVTKCVRPLTVWKASGRNPENDAHFYDHPDLFHPPVYPAVLSAGFRIFEALGLDPFDMSRQARFVTMPAEQWIVIPFNQIFAMLTGWLLYSLGKRLFTREIALLGVIAYFTSKLIWADVISGLNVTMAGFFVLAAFRSMVVAMLNRRDRTSKWKWMTAFFFSIVFASAAFLTRYIAIAAVPGILLFAWLMGGGFRGGTRFVLVFSLLFAVMAAPWFYRNYKVCGNPFGMTLETALVDTAQYPDRLLERQLSPDFEKKGPLIDQVKKKWGENLARRHPAALLGMGGGILLAFFVTALFYRFVRPPVNYLQWGVWFSLLLTLLIAGFFSGSSFRMLHAYWPFIVLYGLAFFYILLDRLDMGVRLYALALKIGIVALGAVPLIMTVFVAPHVKVPYPPYYPPAVKSLSDMLNEREIMCTDMPWATAWYGNRVSLLLPLSVDDFLAVNDEKHYVSAIYLTPITKDKPFLSSLLKGSDKDWLPFMGGRIPEDFPLQAVVALNQNDQVFISDRNRWGGGENPE